MLDCIWSGQVKGADPGLVDMGAHAPFLKIEIVI
jgi:hypothetical protein